MQTQTQSKIRQRATLPYELLAKIADSTLSSGPNSSRNKTLTTLARTTRTFQTITESILYRFIDISLSDPSRAKHLAHALASNTLRATYVRHLSIHGLDGSIGSDEPHEDIYALITQSINGRLTNLAHLTILDVPARITPSLLYALTPSVSVYLGNQPKLKTFTSNILPSISLSRFLIANRGIRALVLPYSTTPSSSFLISPIPPYALPCLELIAARTELVIELVPGRPVQIVVVDYTVPPSPRGEEESEFEDLVCAFGRSTAPNGVHSLGLHVRREPAQVVTFSGETAFPTFACSDTGGRSVRSVNVYSAKKATEVAPSLSNLHSAFPNAREFQVDCLTFPWWAETTALLADIASHLAVGTSTRWGAVPRRGEKPPPRRLERVVFRDSGFSRAVTAFVWDERRGEMRLEEDEDEDVRGEVEGKVDRVVGEAGKEGKGEKGHGDDVKMGKRISRWSVDRQRGREYSVDSELFRRVLGRGMIWQ